MSNWKGKELLLVIANVKNPRVIINSGRKYPKDMAFVGFWRKGISDCQALVFFSHFILCTQNKTLCAGDSHICQFVGTQTIDACQRKANASRNSNNNSKLKTKLSHF